jgi:hypothetical protein
MDQVVRRSSQIAYSFRKLDKTSSVASILCSGRPASPPFRRSVESSTHSTHRIGTGPSDASK